MTDPNKYRGNSKASREQPAPPRREKEPPAISTPPVMKKRSPISKLGLFFTSDDARSVGRSVIEDVIFPAIKDLIFDSINEGSARALYGFSRQGSGRGGRPVGRNMTTYNRPVRRDEVREEPRSLSRRERSTHDFSNFTFRSAPEAEAIIERLERYILEYGTASVSDFYDAIGITSEFTDVSYGWTSLRGAMVRRVRDGYILELPQPRQLENQENTP